ncbi:hypothetical protein SAMN05428962_2312 [Paenibacillus sp. BC26]|nr:hypothetical protein SAMN05428962_2312 [Paenibacillus sp. BC26]
MKIILSDEYNPIYTEQMPVVDWVFCSLAGEF